MKIINGEHDSKDNERVPFSTLKPGDFFIHSSRVLVKVDKDIYQIEHEKEDGASHSFKLVSAVRIGHIDDPEESRKIAGKTSNIGQDTKVKLVDNIAAMYLKG